MEIAADTEKTNIRSEAKSWLAVVALGLVIYGVIRGITWLWAGQHVGDWGHGWSEGHPVWLLRMYGYTGWPEPEPWRWPVICALALVIAISLLVALISVRRLIHHPQEAERRVLVIGSWALYLPSALGSLPAVFGLIGGMVTPMIAAGLVPLVGWFLPREVSLWVSYGVVGDPGLYIYDSHRYFIMGQPLVAFGLALAIVGFVQVFRAYREKRLQMQGLYATVRHPQHLGIAVCTFGLALAVDTTAAYLMWFTMTYFYVLLALREEHLMAQQFGAAHSSYRGATPFMIPYVNISLAAPRSGWQRVAAFVAYYVAGLAVLCLIMGAIGVYPTFWFPPW